MLMGPVVGHNQGIHSWVDLKGELVSAEQLDHQPHSPELVPRDQYHASHSLSHTLADHAHDVPTLIDVRGQSYALRQNMWTPITPRSHDQDRAFGLERPPRV